MSKLQDLIKKNCPDGVPYRLFGDVLDFHRGMTITEKDATPGDFPVIAGGQKPAYYHNVFNREGETIAVAGSGAYAGFVSWWTTPIFLSDAFSVHPKDNSLLPKFVFYCMKNMQEKIHNTKKGSGVPHVHGSSIAKFLIPIPPIEVQEEIVRILDIFSAHAAELQAELQARKEQYEYYRNLLLTFSHACGAADDEQKINNVTTWGGGSYEINWKTMGEIGKFFGGLTGKSKDDFSDGNARFISYMNVYSNIALNQQADEYVRINANEKQNTLKYGDALFTGSSETPDECGMSSVVTYEPTENLYLNSFCFGYRLNDPEIFDPEFLKHLLRSHSIRSQIAKTANGVTRFNVSKALFAKIILPIPDIKLQNQIASILDRFETLVNDLSTGLPAEIAAVKEQYEYYRNKLLTFKQIA